MSADRKRQKILFVGLSCVGDAVMTTPVLQALHQAFPGAIIDIVADRRSFEIFQHCPYRGNIFYKDKQRFLRGAPALLKELLATRYDVVVDLRTDGLACLMRGKEKYTKRKAVSYGPHAIESFMGVIRGIHGDRDIPATTVWLTEAEQEQSAVLLEQRQGGSVLALAPGCGGKRPEKFWPTAHYAELANKLADVFDFVLLLGAGGDRQLTQEIAAGIKLPQLDLSGQTSLLEAAALLQNCRMFVGSDSGLGHLAGAVSTPTLTFFSVDDPSRCLPSGPSAHWLAGENRDARNISVAAAENCLRQGLES